ncbi:MAG TPA: T9SS type A sorting domain-containing protein [Bacteroidia bacterium]|nr:T9SS type A sorting domain-containing protein [Bacteroidia bacterium]HRG52945.1 T9SS type A sorting domain-containing protein [Bacteroidia bacterium]
MIKKTIYFLLFTQVVAQTAFGQVTMYNDGMATVSIVSGTTVSILGGYTSQTKAGVNGKMDNQGTLQLTGDWTNNNSAATPNVFSTSAGTVVFNGTATQTLGGTATTTFYNLTFNNDPAVAGNVTLATNNYTTTNQITMTQGIVNLNSQTLTLGSTGVASTLSRSANTWFYGGTFTRNWLNATAITSSSGNYYGLFPMGESTTASYSPLEINSTVSPGSNGTFSVTYSPSPGNLTDLSPVYNDGGTNIERIVNSAFTTSVSGIATGTYDINVTMTGLNATAGALSNIRLAVFTGGTTASGVGTHAAATGTLANPTARRTGVSAANLSRDFRIATANKSTTPLPVTLLSFTATPNGDWVNLYWATASETNNDYFIVQRSKDNLYFENLEQEDGAGNSVNIRKYTAIDYDPYNGISYYRLKQVDFNGVYQYSKVVSVNFNDEKALTIYPTISYGAFEVSLTGVKDKQITLIVRNLLGQTFYSKAFISDGHVFTQSIDLSGQLTAGAYMVTILSGQEVFSKKMVIQ